MLKAENIRILIEEAMMEKGFFLVDIKVRPSNKIIVYADTLNGITLDDCVSISRLIENKLNRDVEDYELEVSSPGIDNPLKLPVQYQKSTGRPVRVVQNNGETKEGILRNADDEKFTLEIKEMKKQPGKKKETKVHPVEISYNTVKTAKLLIR
ncbi:MAG: ribosome assembly cofactor RimP [Bacteroidales bacterium]|nr:ribosome assembly cofactor RimP [Bacteroidales bacterium]MBN2762746.1 ribosome assembly cofactor RimP [Bacteroidales bacterium]